MNKLIALLSFFILGITACGSGGGFVGDPNTIQNRTPQGLVTDTNLRYQWLVAANMVANGVDLDPAHSTGLVSDARALTEKPKGVIVTCEQDVPWSEIARVTNNPKWTLDHPDDAVPSNTIWMNSNVPVHGYTILSNPEKVITACSSVGQIDGAPIGIGDSSYEFQNILLYRLGYDVSKR